MEKVMLCAEIKGKGELTKYISDSNFAFEEKLDGTRAKVIIDGKKFAITNRRGENYRNRLIEIEEDLKKIDECSILDGEIVAYHKGVRGFHYAQTRCSTQSAFKQKILAKYYPAEFIAFDILVYKGRNIINLPLIERKKALDSFFAEHELKSIKKIDFVSDNAEKSNLWDKVISQNLEGVVIKRINSPYVFARSQDWKKFKNWKEGIAKFVKYEDTKTGIVGLTDTGDRIAVNGFENANLVKKFIAELGYCNVEIQYDSKEADSDKYRMPTTKRVLGL